MYLSSQMNCLGYGQPGLPVFLAVRPESSKTKKTRFRIRNFMSKIVHYKELKRKKLRRNASECSKRSRLGHVGVVLRTHATTTPVLSERRGNLHQQCMKTSPSVYLKLYRVDFTRNARPGWVCIPTYLL